MTSPISCHCFTLENCRDLNVMYLASNCWFSPMHTMYTRILYAKLSLYYCTNLLFNFWFRKEQMCRKRCVCLSARQRSGPSRTWQPICCSRRRLTSSGVTYSADYEICRITQQRVYECRVNNVDEKAWNIYLHVCIRLQIYSKIQTTSKILFRWTSVHQLVLISLLVTFLYFIVQCWSRFYVSRLIMIMIMTMIMSWSSASLMADSDTVYRRTLLTQVSMSGGSDWERAAITLDMILSDANQVWLKELNCKYNVVELCLPFRKKRCCLEPNLWIRILWFPR